MNFEEGEGAEGISVELGPTRVWSYVLRLRVGDFITHYGRQSSSGGKRGAADIVV